MLTDQVLEWNQGNPKHVEIPDWAKENYRKLAIWLMANNYRVPEGIMEKAEKEC